MTHIPNTPRTILATAANTIAALSAISALVVLWLAWSVAPAHAGTIPDQPPPVEYRPADTHPDPCIIDGERIPEGEYVLVEFPDNEGTTEWGFFGCSRTVTDIATPPTVAPTVAAPTLPATGGEGWLAVVAAGFLFAGLTLVRVARS